MLAKIWKKLLLAICIIACLFNITVKLVNRISLEKVIASEPEGVNIKEVLNITEEAPAVQKPLNNISTYNAVKVENTVKPENFEETYYEEETSNIDEENLNYQIEETSPETENNSETEISSSNEENNKSNDTSFADSFMDRMFDSSFFTELMGF